MHPVPRRQLREIVAQYGTSVLEDPRRCRALLLDFCGSYKGEVNLLVMAVQENVPADLQNASAGIPQPVLFGWLTRRLQDAYFLPEDAARWAVETCAEALAAIARPGARQRQTEARSLRHSPVARRRNEPVGHLRYEAQWRSQVPQPL